MHVLVAPIAHVSKAVDCDLVPSHNPRKEAWREPSIAAARAGRPTLKQAMYVFHGSIAYITFVFVGVALDPFLGGPIL